MKSWLTKIIYEFIDIVYIVIGSVVVIVSYIYSSGGLFGMPASRWTGLLGIIIAFIFLLLPYYFILKVKHNNNI